MKRLLVCLLLVGVVGCGESEQVEKSYKSEQAQKQPGGENREISEKPGGGTREDAIAALLELGAEIERNDEEQIVELKQNGKNYKLTNADLENLRKLTNLKSLKLYNYKITDAGLDHLASLTNLERLTLLSLPSQITDKGLKHLADLTNLKTLTISGKGITDDGLQHLEGLNQMTMLHCWDTKITDDGRDELQESLPNCAILRHDDPF